MDIDRQRVFSGRREGVKGDWDGMGIMSGMRRKEILVEITTSHDKSEHQT